MAGIYIHIPFCVSKCSYCDFYSIASTDSESHSSFLQALHQEVKARAYELQGADIHTIYIGGGTPSLIPAHEIGKVLQLLSSLHHISPDAEVTIECNPGDFSKMDIHQLLEVGVNRFSIGAQSFQPELLRFLTRRHTSDETIRMVHALQDTGVSNYSLDLIYGIPGETMSMLREDLSSLIALNPPHISAYHLMYEQGTPLTSQLEHGAVSELSEDDSLQMFELVNDTLKEAGYEHYEVSNYALPGYRSRHNSSYWQGTNYQGLGPSAHSFICPWRSWNPRSVASYSRQLLTSGFVTRDFEYITPGMGYVEYILTRLRTTEGISLSHIHSTFGTEKKCEVLALAEPYIHSGHLSLHDDHISLTSSGILISDTIIQELS